ncbi:hypothetical protein [Mycolicibacterium alvei]|uniref:Uncharacterized protein n=1 Tax=Mycolicibacterium alvei TaxID=67081 RepID=A0A6N4UNJ9_9MYCO|nr:hypothetical protein [Mycolicibacterium alvei]MCV7000599.1 hypothetical protein [Mycolicibacterium alvei]BBX25515.1 hypothetical protein MALV_06400 [Mycolicibacterium alvei]
MNVTPDELTGAEQAILLVLMAESRPVPNAELARLGPKLDKPRRDRLNRLGLIESTGTRPLVHELTDTGWALCRTLFGADAPPRSAGQGKALYTLLGALHRYFEHADLVPADVFLPADVPCDDVSGQTPEVQLRTAYAGLSTRPGGWVSLLHLRQAVPGLPRPTVDAALISLYQQPGVSLIPEENQKVLTPADREAAVEIGNQDKHLIAIES